MCSMGNSAAVAMRARCLATGSDIYTCTLVAAYRTIVPSVPSHVRDTHYTRIYKPTVARIQGARGFAVGLTLDRMDTRSLQYADHRSRSLKAKYRSDNSIL